MVFVQDLLPPDLQPKFFLTLRMVAVDAACNPALQQLASVSFCVSGTRDSIGSNCVGTSLQPTSSVVGAALVFDGGLEKVYFKRCVRPTEGLDLHRA